MQGQKPSARRLAGAGDRSGRSRTWALLFAVGTLLLAACDPPPSPSAHVSGEEAASPALSSNPSNGPWFTDVTSASGIDFTHESGARGKKYNPETFGPGAGWIDADTDGQLDLLLVNGTTLEGAPDPEVTPALYRNLGGGRFANVTKAAGLDFPFYGMGFSRADVDSDGDPDILLYGLHGVRLLENDGGRFRDATHASGLDSASGWIGGVAFFDFDRDGVLDLFIGRYVTWSPEREEGVDCSFGTAEKKYCPVAAFPASPPLLFRGRGDGKFVDASEVAGLRELEGKVLGVAVEDVDRNGYPDLLVANDSVPNFLLLNQGDGSFVERGLESGFATDGNGAALAGMGIDTLWTDSGDLCVAIGNFSGEPTTFHVKGPEPFFSERSFGMGIGHETLGSVTFGLLLEDFDRDGEIDLAAVNGHVFDVEAITRIPYRQKPQVFRGTREGVFRELSAAQGGSWLDEARIGRALAAADFDGDGDLDFVTTANGGDVRLLRNDTPARDHHSLVIDLEGRESHRDAIGAEVELRLSGPDGERRVRRTRKASSSYLSQSTREIFAAWRDGERLVAIEVRWPRGRRESFHAPANARVKLIEGEGHAVDPATLGARRVEPDAAPSSPANAIVLRERAETAIEEGRLEDARENLEDAIAREPGDFVAHRRLLVVLYRLRDAAALESAVPRTVERFPSANLLVSHFAEVLRRDGYSELAARLYTEAGKIDPKRADIWTELGNIAFDRGRGEEAIRCYERALALHESIEALTNAGKALTLEGRREDAASYLERALALRADYAPALVTLGGIRVGEERYDEAKTLLERALRQSTAPRVELEAHGHLGILCARRGETDRAREHFTRVLELDPENEPARRALERLGAGS